MQEDGAATVAMLADDGQVNVDASSEASIEMLDSSLVQNSTAGTGTGKSGPRDSTAKFTSDTVVKIG